MVNSQLKIGDSWTEPCGCTKRCRFTVKSVVTGIFNGTASCKVKQTWTLPNTPTKQFSFMVYSISDVVHKLNKKTEQPICW